MVQMFLTTLAIIALLGVIFEEKTHVSKAKITLVCGCLSWLILFIANANGAIEETKLAFGENIAEIANLWLFLIAAMTFVAYLNKKGLIQNAIYLLLPSRISMRKLMYLTGVFCFVFSSLADNITATLVSVALILSLPIKKNQLMRFSVMVIFSVNSGGVALISGDVTTLMIFLAGKVSIINLLLLSVPALVAVLVLAMLLSWNMKEVVEINKQTAVVRKVDLVIAGLFLTTILSTIFLNFYYAIPPVLTFLSGLSLMFLVARFYKDDIEEDPILEYIRLVEFETLFFFLGVLLIVGMLQQTGSLEHIADIYTQIPPNVGNYSLGLLSALIDNVPLTAALLKTNLDMSIAQWLALTYAVGVGGSLLVIGSASGIVCMSKVPGLTMTRHARYIPQILVAYTIGFLVTQSLAAII